MRFVETADGGFINTTDIVRVTVADDLCQLAILRNGDTVSRGGVFTATRRASKRTTAYASAASGSWPSSCRCSSRRASQYPF